MPVRLTTGWIGGKSLSERLLESARQAGDLRHDRIETLKRSIEREEYIIDPHAVAERMLLEALLENLMFVNPPNNKTGSG